MEKNLRCSLLVYYCLGVVDKCNTSVHFYWSGKLQLDCCYPINCGLINVCLVNTQILQATEESKKIPT